MLFPNIRNKLLTNISGVENQLVTGVVMSDDERDFYKSIQYALVVPALEWLKEQRALSETADRLGIQKQRLTELKSGNRDLTFYYLSILISGESWKLLTSYKNDH